MGEAKPVKVEIEGKPYEFPVSVGSENEKGFDISNLRAKTGYITMDNGYANTSSCHSAITFFCLIVCQLITLCSQ